MIRLPGSVGNNISRSVLGLEINLADILADDTEADELNAAEEAHDADE